MIFQNCYFTNLRPFNTRQRNKYHGNFLFKFGSFDSFDSFGAKDCEFNNPLQITVDTDIKYLYVVDSKNNRSQKYDNNGNFIKSCGINRGYNYVEE